MKRIVVVGLALALAVIPAAFVAQPRVAHANNYNTHIVKPGETLDGIAGMYGVSAQSIAAANKLVNPDMIYAGQVLAIPGGYAPAPPPPPGPPPAQGCGNCPLPPPPPPSGGCGSYYVVQPGNTLTGIALANGVTVQALASANNVPWPYDKIYAGQSLYIPCGYVPAKPPHGKPYYPPHPAKPHPAKPQPAPKPTAHHTYPANCARPAQIVEPQNRQQVSGTLMIVGTASIPNFQFYKVEYAMGTNPLDSDFHSIGDVHHTEVVDGVLATWYVGNMPAGDYTLRLTVVDVAGQTIQPCNVHIHVN
jgi:LysM repeat protein